jgi:4-aminobutyrate aminotransferase/(S)-3-amino-2-methylpropionate transaminase
MIGFDLVKERGGFEPDKEAAVSVVRRALDLGLVLLSCGTHGNVIRILVPLTVQDSVLEEGLDKLDVALAA